MKPLMYSDSDAQTKNIGWKRWGNNIKYYKNNIKYLKKILYLHHKFE